MVNKTTHVWTEQPGMQILVEAEGHLRHILIVDQEDDPETDPVKLTLALPSRQASAGAALLPECDQRALRIGRAVLDIASNLTEPTDEGA